VLLERFPGQGRVNNKACPGEREECVKQIHQSRRNLAEYGYPSTDLPALSAKALEVSQRLTERYGEVPFSDKDPLSQLVDILLSHRSARKSSEILHSHISRHFLFIS
jgi:endonuclease-3